MSVYIPKSISLCKLCMEDRLPETIENGNNVFTVGIGGCKIARPPHVLKTTLGSCIGITLYDRLKKIGGLLHIMLPNRTNLTGRMTKFADTGIPNLIDCMVKEHLVSRSVLVARIFGGARMFNIYSAALDIGQKNEITVTNVLKECGVKVFKGKTGGTMGSQIFFYVDNGRVIYKTIGGKEEEYKS